jgi:hypothetical protein
MSAVQLVAVFAENKPGQTAAITETLAAANINIRWVTIANSGGFGVMKLLVSDRDLALDKLKQDGFVASLLDVLAVEVPDKPGALQAVAEFLARENINLENASGFVANQRAILIIEARELDQARAILQREGFRVLNQEEMLNL